jgi:hypothetical protein
MRQPSLLKFPAVGDFDDGIIIRKEKVNAVISSAS